MNRGSVVFLLMVTVVLGMLAVVERKGIGGEKDFKNMTTNS